MLREERPYESLSQRMTRDSWVIIFADLLALLLAFFVLIFSMNSIEVKSWDVITDSFAKQLKSSAARTGPQSTPLPRRALNYEARAISLDYLSTLLRNGLRDRGLMSSVTITRLDDSLVVSMFTADAYSQDQSGMNPGGRAIVFELASLLSQLKNSVAVVGHASPDEAAEFSNLNHFAFTLERASRVALALQNAGYARPFEVVGKGHSGFAALAPRANPDTRLRLASRVDIVIMEQGTDG
jgi:chemotaxis protein MotB